MINRKDMVSSNGGIETHTIITITDSTLSFAGQLQQIELEYASLRKDCGEKMHPVFCRWFLSDAANQAHLLPSIDSCAVSIVEQPPLSLTKAALWVWMMEDVRVEKIADNVFSAKHGNYEHIFESGRCRSGKNSEEASYEMLMNTDMTLRNLGVNLLENCVRTWFFVQNVDINYSGVVAGRNRAFKELGLTSATRFIASTGIGGRHADKTVTVQMDSYSVKGLAKGQMKQINAPEYLNSTYEYGVAFERATSVDYGDRRHLFISGTASIDNKGEIVWPRDVHRQTIRMWTNVEALLNAGGCSWENVGQIFVYLRDPADFKVVREMFDERFPDTPHIIVLAPVCRPGWLIEMECMAMKPIKSPFPSL